MSYIKGVIHGMVVGTVVGLSVAPHEGARTREQIRAAAVKVQSGLHKAQETAQRVVPQAREAAESVGGAIDGIRQRVTHRRTEEVEVSVAAVPVANGHAVPA